MRPGVPWRIGLALTLAALAPGRGLSAEPDFIAHRADGTAMRGPLRRLGVGWETTLGGEMGGRVVGAELVRVRQAGVALPPFPVDEHLILVNGDRVPVREVRLANERLHFRHADLEGDRETS